MEVNLHDVVLPLPVRFRFRFGGGCIDRLLLHQGILQILGRDVHLAGKLVIAHHVVEQSRRLEEIARLESVQLVELHGVDAQLHAHGRLEDKRRAVLEGNELDTDALVVVQLGFLELLQEVLHVRLHHPVRTHAPGVSLRAEVGVIEVIVGVVHQISLERRGADGFDVHRHEGQEDVQSVARAGFGLAIGGYLRLFYLGFRLHGAFGFFLFLGSRLRGGSGDVVVIGLYHHTFTDGHGDVEAVFILH